MTAIVASMPVKGVTSMPPASSKLPVVFHLITKTFALKIHSKVQILHFQSMPCLKAFLIPAESRIFKWNGYMLITRKVINDMSKNFLFKRLLYLNHIP